MYIPCALLDTAHTGLDLQAIAMGIVAIKGLGGFIRANGVTVEIYTYLRSSASLLMSDAAFDNLKWDGRDERGERCGSNLAE